MERLTKRVDGIAVLESWAIDKDPVSIIQRLCNRLAAYEETLLEPKEVAGLCAMDKRSRMAKMLRWEEAEQDGRLVVLPCKVGDRVFHVRRVTQAEAKRMGAPVRHRGIVYYGDRPFAIKEKLCTKSDYAQIGKTVFLTREEAEAALALKGGEG